MTEEQYQALKLASVEAYCRSSLEDIAKYEDTVDFIRGEKAAYERILSLLQTKTP